MPYASRADLEDRYGADEVAQRESMLPDGAVDRILLAVDAQVDAYLAARYAVPLLPALSPVTQGPGPASSTSGLLAQHRGD